YFLSKYRSFYYFHCPNIRHWTICVNKFINLILFKSLKICPIRVPLPFLKHKRINSNPEIIFSSVIKLPGKLDFQREKYLSDSKTDFIKRLRKSSYILR